MQLSSLLTPVHFVLPLTTSQPRHPPSDRGIKPEICYHKWITIVAYHTWVAVQAVHLSQLLVPHSLASPPLSPSSGTSFPNFPAICVVWETAGSNQECVIRHDLLTMYFRAKLAFIRHSSLFFLSLTTFLLLSDHQNRTSRFTSILMLGKLKTNLP